MPSGKNLKKTQSKPRDEISRGLPNILTKAGFILIAFGLTIILFTFAPILKNEFGFAIKHTILKETPKHIQPTSTDFGIVIPKIEANAKIIANVDPYDSRVYQRALTQGVAHAKGTSVPGVAGNMFLFSHSSVNFYDATRYNSIFYLLSKLEIGDTIDTYYKGDKYIYTVTSKRMVGKDAVQYLKSVGGTRQILTLMTCWPPGTSYQRLIVIAERSTP